MSARETLMHDLTKLPPSYWLFSLCGRLESFVDVQYFLLRKLEQLHQQFDLTLRQLAVLSNKTSLIFWLTGQEMSQSSPVDGQIAAHDFLYQQVLSSPPYDHSWASQYNW